MAALFSKVKDKSERAKLVEFLTFAVQNLQSNTPTQAPKEYVEKALKAEPGLFSVQGEPNAAGLVTVIPTETAISALQPKAPVAIAAPATSAIVLETGIQVPAAKRGGIRASIYPFASMGVGQSFFLPLTEENPNVIKSMSSTVSGTNKRYAAVYPAGHDKAGQPTGKDGRKFVARPMEHEGTKQKGVRVFRIA